MVLLRRDRAALHSC